MEPFEILVRVEIVAYRIALLSQSVHKVFYITMLQKYEPDPWPVLNYQPLDIRENMTSIERNRLLLRSCKAFNRGKHQTLASYFRLVNLHVIWWFRSQRGVWRPPFWVLHVLVVQIVYSCLIVVIILLDFLLGLIVVLIC